MATYYARNVTGNWASNTSWDTVGSGGAGPAGPPVAGDTAIFDAGFTGTITIAAAAACATLTALAGATGTLTWGAFTLTMTANPTFVSGFHLTGSTGRLTLSSGCTITSGGLSIPGNVSLSSGTYVLADALTVVGQLLMGTATVTLSGAFDLTCGTCVIFGSVNLVAGQKLNVSAGLQIQPTAGSAGSTTVTVKSVTASSPTYIAYTGAVSAVKVFNIVFTDVDFSTFSTPVTNLDNWYGSTLTRTVGITNRTSADIGGGGVAIFGG